MLSNLKWDIESKKLLVRIINACLSNSTICKGLTLTPGQFKQITRNVKSGRKRIEKALELFDVKRIKFHYQIRVGGNKKINLDKEIKKVLEDKNEKT